MTAIHETHFEGVSAASGASLSEAIGGIAAIVLTILGLAHVAPNFLVAVATIAVGVARLSGRSGLDLRPLERWGVPEETGGAER